MLSTWRRKGLILLLATFFALLLGCASSNKYRPAELVARDKNYAHLSDGYTDDEILRNIDYPSRKTSDKIYFVTYGSSSPKVGRSWESVLAAYRATEIAKQQGFGGITLFNERPPFENKFVLLNGSRAYSLDGTISSSGHVSGTLSNGTYLEINSDRGHLPAEKRWGSAYYAVLSKECSVDSSQPYVKLSEPTKYKSKDPEPFIQTETCLSVNKLNWELTEILSGFLK